MKLKRIKESYSDIDSSNAWDAYDLAIEYLGADELCEALAKAMGTDELASNLAYIFRMYEIPFGDDEDDDFEESVRKNRKISRSMQEAGRMVNGKVSELSPQHDARKSFYGKAKVVTDSDGTQILYSYNTPVVEIKDDKVVLKPMWDSSATTLRHVKEFLKQNGFEVGSKAQLAKMYGGANESIRRSNRKRSMKESFYDWDTEDVSLIVDGERGTYNKYVKTMGNHLFELVPTVYKNGEFGYDIWIDGTKTGRTGFEVAYDAADEAEYIYKYDYASDDSYVYGEGCGSKKRKSKKRKSMKESFDEANAYVVFRQYYNDYTDSWEPIAFWWGDGQSMTYGRVNIIEQDGMVPYMKTPRYVNDEADINYFGKTKAFGSGDDGFDEFSEYVKDYLSKDESGDGFDNVIYRTRLDRYGIKDNWR